LAPQYFPPQLKKDIRGRLKDKLFLAAITPAFPMSEYLREWGELATQRSDGASFHGNAERVLEFKYA